MKIELPKIDWNEISKNILWAEDWWDGIVSGVAELDGRRIYFNCIDEDKNGNKIFAVYELPKEIWQVIDERHSDFVNHVGEHFDFVRDSSGKPNRKTQDIHPQSEHSKFYEKWHDREIEFDKRWQIATAEENVEKS